MVAQTCFTASLDDFSSLFLQPLNYGNQASKKSSTLIDWTSRPLQMFLAGVGFLLFSLIICGVSLSKYRRWKKSVENKGMLLNIFRIWPVLPPQMGLFY